jgi:hypothetical protein
MAVVIHEFEVEVQPESQATGAIAPATSAPAPSPGTQEIERTVRRLMDRCARVWAH